MRLGKASPASSAECDPARAFRRRRARRNIGYIDREFKREMREDMTHHAGNVGATFPAFLEAKRGALFSAVVLVKIRRPLGRRHFGHAAEQALGRPRAHQHETVGAACDESGAAAQDPFPLRHSSRKCLRIAANASRAASFHGHRRTGRHLRRADGGAEIHHRLGEIAGAARRRQRLAPAGKFPALAAGSGVSTA